MACGALGGLFEPPVRRAFSAFIYNTPQRVESSASLSNDKSNIVVCTKNIENKDFNEGNHNGASTSEECISETSELTHGEDESIQETGRPLQALRRILSVVKEVDVDNEAEDDSDSESGEDKPMAVELLAAFCFLISAGLLSTPVLVDENNPYAFTLSLVSFLIYELVVGLYMPCEGVLRSIYMPNDSICSLMTMLRVIVNVAVALGVISSNYIPFATAFGWCSFALIIAACIQLSLVQKSEWISLSRSIANILSLGRETSKSMKDGESSTAVPKLKFNSPQSSTASSEPSSSYLYSETSPISIERKNQ